MTDVDEGLAAEPGRPRPAIVREAAGARTRTLDDPHFAVDNGRSSVTFRLQLFTGLRLRPVALLTQASGEGDSIINRAESCAEAVWQRCCPDEPRPPVILQHFIMNSGEPEEKSFGVHHVDFTPTGPFAVARPPIWGAHLSIEDLQHLVGTTVDIGRGPFTPKTYPDEPQMRFAPAWVVFLPTPDLDDDDPACLHQTLTWSQRLTRQLRGRRHDQGCCWYHGGDWHRVCRVALRAVRNARRDGTDEDDLYANADQTADDAELSDWEREALTSLFLEPLDVSRDRGIGYVNGRHRSHALLAAGVHRVPVTRWT